MYTPTRNEVTGSIDDRMIAAMRFLLAMSALLIIYLDPSESRRYLTAISVALGGYILYSAALYLLALRRSPALAAIDRHAHWIDVGWYVVFVAASNGPSSLFFFFFFFAILVASFRWGYVPGLRVTVVSALLFTIVGLLTTRSSANLELSRFALRPAYLLILGYMMAYWGGREITLKRRLALLKEVTTLSNPRFGVDHTIATLMEQVRSFYDADACLLVTLDDVTGTYFLRRADRHARGREARPVQLPPELGSRLLALPRTLAAVFTRRPARRGQLPLGVWYHAGDVTTGARVGTGRETCDRLASLLDTESFVSVPFRYRTQSFGRLYLTAGRQRAFDDSDVDFLLQVVEHVVPVIDNVRLVDRLASEAAEEERRRIARDLHDSVIQPYIGLQIALGAVRQKLAGGSGDVGAEIDRLIEMTKSEIDGLRQYIRGLRDGSAQEGTLLAAVRRFSQKFAEATGIAVEVEAEEEITLSGRLAAEAFQMVAEGLSNVRRHTKAARATIGLRRRNGSLVLRIENDGTPGVAPTPFTPKSIVERAASLGGQATVEQRPDGGSAVVVTIPL